MANRLQQPQFKFTCRALLQTASATLIATTLWSSPALAKDPFRTTDVRPISDQVENAFRAAFEEGNYSKARTYLNQANSNDPLTNALRACLAYMDRQSETKENKDRKAALLEEFKAYAVRTRESASQMVNSDPLRGNLYLAVGNFMEGAYVFEKEGTVKGTSNIVGKLQQIFGYLKAAEKESPNDPEFNLIKGYMDLFIGLNLPFADPNKAMERLDKYAAPRYLAQRGIAIGYRDLNQPDKALAAVDQALAMTPGNPELLYLKAQIFVKQGNHSASIPFFQGALAKKDQLPASVVRQIDYELRKAQQRASR